MVRFEEDKLVITVPSDDAVSSWAILHEQLCSTLSKLCIDDTTNTWMLLLLLEELMPEQAVAERMLNANEGKEV